MATLKDVARAAGLSITQTSRALNGHSDVNEATRKRVKAVARSMNYQANISARKLVTGRSGMVALVVPQSGDLPQSGLFIEGVAGLSAQFSARAMQFVLHVARQDEPILEVYRRLIGNGMLDGFVLFSPHDDDPRAAFLREQGIPFVGRGHQLLQGRQGGGVHQEHAVFVEPDQPLVGAKANEIAQVAIRRVSGGAHVLSSGLLRCSVEVVMTGKIGRGSGCVLLYHAHRPASKGSVHSLGL